MIVSVFSPEIHSSLFHSGEACPHGKHGKSCSHEKNSSEGDFENCAVVLFAESTEHHFVYADFSECNLLDFGLYDSKILGIYTICRVQGPWVRGPPELI